MLDDNELVLKDHYILCADVFPYIGDTPATCMVRYEDLHSALNVYLDLFLHCDFVKSCTLFKHLKGVPKSFYLAHFTRTKEFKNFLPLSLDKPPYYVYNKAILGYLFEEINILEV